MHESIYRSVFTFSLIVICVLLLYYLAVRMRAFIIINNGQIKKMYSRGSMNALSLGMSVYGHNISLSV